jgi:hypothetical protein
MSPLPNIHDHSLLEYRVDLADRQVTLITLPESARTNPGSKALETVFSGMESHHFGPVAAGVIFLDIEEAPLSNFLPAHELEFNEGVKTVGAPAWWRGSVSQAEKYLAERDVHAFEISSSYGFDGWVLAVSVRQIIAKRAKLLKNIQVIDGALNSTFSVFQATDREFALIFSSKDQEIQYSEDLYELPNAQEIDAALRAIWERPIRKRDAHGIHGTLFYQLQRYKEWYPANREEAVTPSAINAAQRKLFGST